MIVSAAVVPSTPLLLPGASGRPVAEVEELALACRAAIGTMLAAAPGRVVVVGAGDGTQGESPLGRYAPWPGRLPGSLPVALAVGRHLLAGAELLAVAPDAAPQECAALGAELAAGHEPTGLLVVADGSARRGPKAPGYVDPRAASFDAAVTDALGAADSAALAGLDPALAGELLVAGRPAWQVLAGATIGSTYDAEVHYAGDPFGVWYLAVSWR